MNLKALLSLNSLIGKIQCTKFLSPTSNTDEEKGFGIFMQEGVINCGNFSGPNVDGKVGPGFGVQESRGTLQEFP
jgi:hypothetical protein